MKTMSVSNDIVPLGQFKANLSKMMKSIRGSGRQLIITQNGKPAAVVLSPSDYDELVYRSAFIKSIEQGKSDADAGLVMSTEELRAELKKRRSTV